MVEDQRDALVVGQLGEGLLDPGAALVGVDALEEGVGRRELDGGGVLLAERGRTRRRTSSGCGSAAGG
jgi:hypothetical protein